MRRAVIVGAGAGGLSSALLLGRAGFDVTVLEQDPAPSAADVEAAFAADRRGAPQVHQTHGFLARLVVELRRRLPDVLERLLAAGCDTLPTTADLGEPREGDEDLKVLVVRRTTFEWVLRHAALAEPSVRFRHGVTVSGLLGRPAAGGAPAEVTGVRTSTGDLEADLVVAANGRRSPIPDWLADLGVEVDETVVESGLMYLSRWYRLPSGRSVELDPKLGGDLGFVKYLAVPGDGDTLSVTLAVRTDDRAVRRALSDPDRFEQACRMLPGPDQFFGGEPLEPIGGVRPMGGLLNRRRRFTAGGEPQVVGFHVVGDAHTCTNPLYGRGCSLALVQAGLLTDAVDAHPDDAVARARAYEEACVREVEPWFDVSVEWDRLGADPAGGGFGGGGRRCRQGAGRGVRRRRHRPGHRPWPGPAVEPDGHPGRPHGRPRARLAHHGGHGRPRRPPRPAPRRPHPGRGAHRPRRARPLHLAGPDRVRRWRRPARRRRRRGPPGGAGPRLPRALLLVASPGSGAGGGGLPRPRARPAGLRPVVPSRGDRGPRHQPGVADEELGRDPHRTMRRMLAGGSGSGDLADMMADDGRGFVDRFPEPEGLPSWLDEAELDHYVEEFRRTGFTGGINWYRNLDRNWELTAHLDGARVSVPSLFIGGRDDPVLVMSPPAVQEGWLTDHRGDVLIDGAGHWVQQEAPEQVNAALLGFLDQLHGRTP